MGHLPITPIVATLLLISACGGGTGSQPSSARTSQPSPALSLAPSPSSGLPKAVWVLTPLGLHIRADASTAAAVIATAGEGAELDVSESRQAGGQTWLHVKSEGGSEGWVLNDPTLVIATPVYTHIDTTLGYRILFPQSWTITNGNPTSIASPPADPAGAVLTIQQAPDLAHLPQTPTQPGKEIRTESPIEVYGKTTFITVYQLDAGGFEFSVRVLWAPDRSYLFDYRQSNRQQADTGLFRQLLISVAIA
jgi:hypothetical protein